MQQLSIHWGPPARVRVGRGTLAGERALLAELDELLDGDLERLAAPILLVVPSISLRRHLLTRLLATRPAGAVLGLDCRTHLGLAATLLEQSRDPTHAALRGPDLFALFARRLAWREAALERSLGHLREGYGAVVGAVRDLLDAGFDPALRDALEEALAAEGHGVASRHELARAAAVVRVAAGTLDAMRRWRLGRSSDLLQQATVELRRRPPAARRVIVYGFNDATGVTIDFLLALLATYGGSVYLDQPPDPSDRSRPDPGLAFCRNFRERIETAIPAREPLDEETPAPRLETFRALGGEAEVREVASRIRQLIAGGAAPERIGVVVRRLDSYAGSLRIQFSRLAIPYSADDRVGPHHPRASRLHAVLELLREGPALPIERWLDGATVTRSRAGRGDLLLALHTLAAGRLEDVAALGLDKAGSFDRLPLPARRGLEESAEQPGVYRAVRRTVGAETLERAVRAATATCDLLSAWPPRAAVGEHAERLRRLLTEGLGWDPQRPALREPFDELLGLVESVPPELEIDYEELQALLGRELADFGRTELGGVGGGVRVLDVTGARSLSFEHLFVLGLNRGIFPRQVHEDPLLTDPLRQVLSRSGFGVLPDLPLKRNGFHEERYLFAQLLSASPRITLSWQEVDDQQKNLRAVSPLVERLRLASPSAQAGDEVYTARPVFSPAAEERDVFRPPYEAAVLAGLAGDREVYREILRLALGDRTASGAKELASARVAVLDEADPELDRNPAALTRLGPWLGLVGEIRPQGDPRPRGELFVTALEGLARCPWRHFLEKVLRVERLPDPLDAVPGVEPQLVGSVVHEALEQIVEEVLGRDTPSWDEALEATGTRVPWPAPESLASLLLATSRAVVARRNLRLPGLDRALALAAAPHLEVARTEDWPGGASRWPVVASEIEGFLEVPDAAPSGDGSRRIRFRADRMDRSDDGFSFTDYKTGRWPPKGTRAMTAGERLLAGVRSGEWLQAAAYALAPGRHRGRGRYLYLNPHLAADAGREYAASSSQKALTEAFARTVTTLLALWDRGLLFPRLLDPKEHEPRLCGICDVSDACVRGDSGARRRLAELVRQWQGGAAASDSERAVVAAWNLARPPRRGKARS